MGIFNKTIESARQGVEKAEQLVADWESKAADARGRAAELDANSGSLVLADEAAADSISLEIHSLERKARAFDQAAGEARRKLSEAQRKVLEGEAKEEERLADVARKTLDDHNTKVDGLLAQLKEIDECDYTVAPMTESWARDLRLTQNPKSYLLARELLRHEIRGSVIRFYLKTGKVARDLYELNSALGTTYSGIGTSIAEEDGFPPVVFEYRDAGITFETVGA